jgi:hypothetical protein
VRANQSHASTSAAAADVLHVLLVVVLVLLLASDLHCVLAVLPLLQSEAL